MPSFATTLRPTKRSEVDPIDHAFPKVDPGILPLGSRVLVQVRRTKLRSDGGIVFAATTLETDKWNAQVAKVIATGPVAFRDRKTLAPWPEGPWCPPGAFVRVPKYNGDRWEVPVGHRDDHEEPALFVIFNDLEIIGLVTCDPLTVRAFV